MRYLDDPLVRCDCGKLVNGSVNPLRCPHCGGSLNGGRLR